MSTIPNALLGVTLASGGSGPPATSPGLRSGVEHRNFERKLDSW